MVIKKQDFDDDEVAIFDEAIIYKRGDYWHFRMWLNGENKYARKSLKTKSKSTAIDKGKDCYLEIYANLKMGKTYFSIDAKQGVEKYVAHREKDVEAGLIVKGRLVTIKTHLKNWLDFTGRDTKLKELSHTDCEDYYLHRIKNAKGAAARQVTVQNEQSTINAMMAYLFRHHETRIDAFVFKKLPRIDRNDDAIRRSTFDAEEVGAIREAISAYCDRRKNSLDDSEWRMRSVAGYYFLIASITGLRTGEQLQLKWGDLWWRGHWSKKYDKAIPLVSIDVRAETSKVRKSRSFYCRDDGYFRALRDMVEPVWKTPSEKDKFVFSPDGINVIRKRALLYHFDKILDLAEIERTNRNLVPYSFRHFFITEKITGGLTYQQVAEMCGTSATQIERTYYHLNDEMRVTHALADYEIDEDGLIRPVGD